MSVLLLAWLNLAMLPCALASGHVSTAGKTIANDSHHSITAEHAHHGTADPTPAATVQPDCCQIGQLASIDHARQPDKKNHDSVTVIAGVAIFASHLHSPATAITWKPSDPPDMGGGSPRLHVLNCVYLD